MNLIFGQETLSVCRFESSIEFPDWALKSKILNITRTPFEMSLVCEERYVPSHVVQEKGWRYFFVEGTLDFSLTGILARLAQPLAEAQISLFALSTFDTDSILVKAVDFEKSQAVLKQAGFTLTVL